MENKYTIVINTYPHKDQKEDLTRCLQSIKSQTYANYTVLIIENSVSDVAVRNILNEVGISNHKIITDPTKKLSYLFNLGWKNADTSHLAYLADDAEATPNWLENIDKELTAYPEVGVCTGPVISTCYPAGEMHRLYLLSQTNIFTKLLAWPYMHFVMEDNPLKPGFLFKSGAYSLGAGLEESKNFDRQEIDLATTTNMGIRRECLVKINGFDEDFWFNHADGDIFIRIKKAGWQIMFNPKVIAYHHVRLGPSRNAYIIGRDTGVFYKKHIRSTCVSSLIGIIMNITVLNLYWIYNFLRTGKASQLKGIYGFLKGILE